MRTLLVFGTRPEAIKMAPVVKACQKHDEVEPLVCLTGQHREMLRQVTDYFQIDADYDLDLMQPSQSLATLTARCLEGLAEVVAEARPDCIVAQGDTTSVLAASIVAFYDRLPFVHVEAGLRTGDLWAPWPEEFNRRVSSLVTTLHCAPTEAAAANLLQEGHPASQVHVTGNTVIDALLETVDRERARAEWHEKYAFLAEQRMVLVTGHRRENFGAGFEQICRALAHLAERFPETQFVYPVHLNPEVQRPVYALLSPIENVHLTDPVPYPEFVWLMHRSDLILTDSGGVQEEAPSIKKPVLVMRETTERPEAVACGACELVGTDEQRIRERATSLLSDAAEYQRHQTDRNPYGDGRAADRIVDLMLQQDWGGGT
ncbi:MAG: UDP-N-acetylglucosamine 2-epimerase (non-hydrolyzing) [Planctomycetota bacterium]